MLALSFVLSFALLIREHRRRGERSRLEHSLLLAAPAAFALLLLLAEWGVLGRLDPILCVFALALAIPPFKQLGTKGPRSWRLLVSSGAPFAVGVLTACLTWWTWGSLSPIPVVHDESAYLLQARIFASGRWTAPGRPLPEFFEQVHVFVTPVLASKYPPGHSLALVPGVWLGLPGLVPVLLAGLSGALVFMLARRLVGWPVAALTWLFWMTAPVPLENRASYLSESTSGALWLLSLWYLLDWKERGGAGPLLRVAACVSWGILTRPLTMAALALPIGIFVISQAVARRAWREIAWAAALGCVILSILPLWSMRTIGQWRTTPYREYSRIYFPYQWAGFVFDESPPQRPLAPGLVEFDRLFRRVQREHRVEALPRILRDRLAAIGRDMWGAGRGALFLFAILGLFRMPREIAFASVSAILLVIAYLAYPHFPAWTVYYLEIQPVLAFLTAAGLWWAVSALVAPLRPRANSGDASAQRRLLPVTLMVFAIVLSSLPYAASVRWSKQQWAEYQREFQQRVASIPAGQAIVFVRYSPGRFLHRDLIANEPDLERARVWIVYDRGPENERLLKLAPGRAPYLYDEARRSVLPLPRLDPG